MSAKVTGPSAVDPTLIAVTSPRIDPRCSVPKNRGNVAASSVRMLSPAAPMSTPNPMALHPGVQKAYLVEGNGGGECARDSDTAGHEPEEGITQGLTAGQTPRAGRDGVTGLAVGSVCLLAQMCGVVFQPPDGKRNDNGPHESAFDGPGDPPPVGTDQGFEQDRRKGNARCANCGDQSENRTTSPHEPQCRHCGRAQADSSLAEHPDASEAQGQVRRSRGGGENEQHRPEASADECHGESGAVPVEHSSDEWHAECTAKGADQICGRDK